LFFHGGHQIVPCLLFGSFGGAGEHGEDVVHGDAERVKDGGEVGGEVMGRRGMAASGLVLVDPLQDGADGKQFTDNGGNVRLALRQTLGPSVETGSDMSRVVGQDVQGREIFFHDDSPVPMPESDILTPTLPNRIDPA
jgi:hypothetical protein